MKHLLRGLFIAVLFICCNFQLVLAQPMQELPVDKNVRIGKLDNGLTFLIIESHKLNLVLKIKLLNIFIQLTRDNIRKKKITMQILKN